LQVIGALDVDQLPVDDKPAVGQVKTGLSEGLDVLDFDELPQAGVVVGLEFAHADGEG